MYTLFGYKNSGSAAVEICLEMAGLPYELIEAASWRKSSRVDDLARYNPLRQIPTLSTPDGEVLTESAAIIIHLGLAHPQSGILPQAPDARAQAIRGLVFIAANCYALISIIDYPARYLPPDADKAERSRLVKGSRSRLHLHWDAFADQFTGSPFLGGEQPGGLDALAVVVSKWSGTRQFLRRRQPAFYQLLRRIEGHGAVASVLERHWQS